MLTFRSLVLTGTVGALALAASTFAADKPHKDLTVVSWGGSYTRSQMLAYVQPYRERIGEWVQMETYDGGLDEIRNQVETANVIWDVVDFELADLIRGCQEGLLEEIDHTTLPPGDDGTAASKDFIDGAFTECGVGQTVWATVVAYDTQRFAASPPTRLEDFFDLSSFPGRRGLRRDPRANLEWGLLADGATPNQVYDLLETEEGQERAFATLDRIRNSITWWTIGSEPVELLDKGVVSMSSVWNGRMYRPIVEQKKDFEILWDGQVWDIDSWGIPKGGYNYEKAMDFIRFATGSGPLAEQAKYISYGPARRSSVAMIGDDIKEMLPTAPANMDNALQLNAAWWATHYEDLSAKFERWLAGGNRGLSGSAR